MLIHTDMETEERKNGFTDWWYVLPPDHCVFFKHRTFEVMLQDSPHRICHKDPRYVVMRKPRRTKPRVVGPCTVIGLSRGLKRIPSVS